MLAVTELHLTESFPAVSVGKVPFPLPPQWTPELAPQTSVGDGAGMRSDTLTILCKRLRGQQELLKVTGHGFKPLLWTYITEMLRTEKM